MTCMRPMAALGTRSIQRRPPRGTCWRATVPSALPTPRAFTSTHGRWRFRTGTIRRISFAQRTPPRMAGFSSTEANNPSRSWGVVWTAAIGDECRRGYMFLYSNVVNGYSYFSFTCSLAAGCHPPGKDSSETVVQRMPRIFLATGDNDVFFRNGITGQWSDFDALGDAGQILVDNGSAQSLLARNGNYVAYLSEPGSQSV